MADFFVHPDFHRLKGREMTEEVHQYEAALHQKIGASALPILIYDPDQTVKDGEFWNCFPEAQRFRSIPEVGWLHTDGETLTNFNKLLAAHIVKSGVVHGSYLGECVHAFKSKLSAHRETHVLYARSAYDIGFQGDIDEPWSVTYGQVLRDSTQKPRTYLPEFWDLASYRYQRRYYAEDARIFSTSQYNRRGRAKS